MSYERLLNWMSELGGGSFAQFDAAHSWATRGSSIWSGPGALRELSALGHIEVDWGTRRWVAARPCITLLPDAAGHGLVVGGRTARLTRALLDEVDALDAEAIARSQRDAPDVVYIQADSEVALAGVAAGLGVSYVHSVVDDLGDLLPSLAMLITDTETHPIVQHYGIERYDLDARWLAVETDDEPGLYRYERPGPRAVHFVDAAAQRYAIPFAIGVWLEARRTETTDWIWWHPDAVNGTLDVPFNLPLPPLHARAATLCSGLTPLLREGSLRYANVPFGLAERIAVSLEQELVIKQEN